MPGGGRSNTPRQEHAHGLFSHHGVLTPGEFVPLARRGTLSTGAARAGWKRATGVTSWRRRLSSLPEVIATGTFSVEVFFKSEVPDCKFHEFIAVRYVFDVFRAKVMERLIKLNDELEGGGKVPFNAPGSPRPVAPPPAHPISVRQRGRNRVAKKSP